MKNLEFIGVSQSLFPIPIKTYNFSNDSHELNEMLMDDIEREYQEDPAGTENSNFGGWHSKFSLETKYDSFEKLRGIVEDCGRQYCDQLGYESNINCDLFWANMNVAGDINLPHHHQLSALTGVYYPVGYVEGSERVYNYTDKPVGFYPHSNNGVDGGSLVLWDPSHGKRVQLSPITDQEHNSSSMHIYPTSGVLVLFPTFLIHSVLPFRESNRKRFSISFGFSYGND